MTTSNDDYNAPYSCKYDYFGCTDPIAENYLSWNTISWPAMCQYAGCNDTDAKNFDSQATYNDGTCSYYKIGCTVSALGS